VFGEPSPNPANGDVLALRRIGRMQLLDLRRDEAVGRVGGGRMRRLQVSKGSRPVNV